LGDGWHAVRLAPGQVRGAVKRLRTDLADANRDPAGFRVVLRTFVNPGDLAHELDSYAAAGVDELIVEVPETSTERRLRVLARVRAAVGRQSPYDDPRGLLIDDPAAMLELVRLVLATLVAAARSRQSLVVENLLLRQQLQVALRSRRHSRLRSRDKLSWLLVRRLNRDWRRHLLLVRPKTVLGWHRRGWRLFWRWRSGHRLGRPRLNAEVRSLIATMRRENPHWGTERIRGELLKLGIAVSARSIRRHRRRWPARPPSQSWRTFLANHAQAIWAADLFVVQTLTFQTLYVFLIRHDRRRLLHFDVTAHPTAAWVWRQLIEATPWGQHPKYLIHDHDRVYGADTATRMAGLHIESIRTPIQAARANAIAERVVRNLRRECLDHILPLSEGHVRSVLAEFVSSPMCAMPWPTRERLIPAWRPGRAQEREAGWRTSQAAKA
jgi:putative transposase